MAGPDIVMIGLAGASLATSVVIPVAIEVAPAVWKAIIKILKNMNLKRAASAGEDHHNLSIIQSTMAKLERIRDIPEWLRIPKATSLLAMLQSQAKSLKTMIDKHILRTSVPSKKILSEHIKSIAVLLQRLDNNAGLDVYQKRKENLHKDLLDVLSKDNLLVPVIRAPSEEVTTFPGIRYEFPARTQLSSSVIECIECALRWLRDFKLESCGPVRGSIDVALYEVFTEILPDALMDHLERRRSGPIEIKQFYSNVCFLRAFSVSSTFREIQGEAGLKMEREEKFDLGDAGWTTWNNLQERIEIDLLPPSGNDLQQQRRGGGDNYWAFTSAVAETSSTRSSEIVDPDDCFICGCHFQGKNLAEVDNLRKQHHDICVKREEERLLSRPVV